MYNGKQLKERVSKFGNDELVTAVFITEKQVRNENTDGWWTNEFQKGFDGTKLTKKQVEKILGKISKKDFDKEVIKECVENYSRERSESIDNLLYD